MTITSDDPAPPGNPPVFDATLKALSLADQDGNLVDIGTFAPATTAYAASVGSQVTGVTTTATPNHPDATVAVTGGAALAEGENTITVTVTAEDGNATQDYVITVTRAAAETANNPPVFDAGPGQNQALPGKRVQDRGHAMYSAVQRCWQLGIFA